jgi:hypothetical protein
MAREVLGRLRRAVAGEVLWRCADDEPNRRDPSRDQARIAKAANAHAHVELLSLLKNLSDHRGCASATATVGHARKFVRSRNPVTVIVKIESRHLDRAPHMFCSTQARLEEIAAFSMFPQF